MALHQRTSHQERMFYTIIPKEKLSVKVLHSQPSCRLAWHAFHSFQFPASAGKA